MLPDSGKAITFRVRQPEYSQMHIGGKNRQRGFTLLEMLIVVAIVLIMAAMIVPRMLEILDRQKLQSSVQAYAGLLQMARMRATADNNVYQALIGAQNGATMAYVDINFDKQYEPQGTGADPQPEPAVQIANPILVTDVGIPPGFETQALLGMVPYNLETSVMVDANGVASPGIAFNERGLPCQRIAAGASCVNTVTQVVPGNPNPVSRPVGWITYFRYTMRSGAFTWAAVTVTPARRIKTWRYQDDGQGGGSWQ